MWLQVLHVYKTAAGLQRLVVSCLHTYDIVIAALTIVLLSPRPFIHSHHGFILLQRGREDEDRS